MPTNFPTSLTHPLNVCPLQDHRRAARPMPFSSASQAACSRAASIFAYSVERSRALLPYYPNHATLGCRPARAVLRVQHEDLWMNLEWNVRRLLDYWRALIRTPFSSSTNELSVLRELRHVRQPDLIARVLDQVAALRPWLGTLARGARRALSANYHWRLARPMRPPASRLVPG